MLNPTKGVNWISRALVLGFTCVAITVVAHAAGGGAVPLVGIVFVAALMVLGAAFATSRELSLGAMFTFLAGSQIACHLLLNGFGHNETSASPLAITSERGAHAMHGVGAGTTDAAIEGVANNHGLTLTMLLAHVFACVGAAVVLREGERVMFSLHRALPNIVRVLFGLVVSRPAAAAPIWHAAPPQLANSSPKLSSLSLASGVTRRGPPAPSLPIFAV